MEDSIDESDREPARTPQPGAPEGVFSRIEKDLRGAIVDSALVSSLAIGLFYVAGSAYYEAFLGQLGFSIGAVSPGYRSILLNGFFAIALGVPLAWAIVWASRKPGETSQKAVTGNGAMVLVLLMGAMVFWLSTSLLDNYLAFTLFGILVTVAILLVVGAQQGKNVGYRFRRKAGKTGRGILLAIIIAALVTPGPFLGVLSGEKALSGARPGVLFSDLPQADVEPSNLEEIPDGSTVWYVAHQEGFFYFTIETEGEERHGVIISEQRIDSVTLRSPT